MIHFERTSDLALIRAIMRQPSVYRGLTDDFCPPAEQFEPLEHPMFWYVLAWEGDELLGLWLFVPQNGVCWEVHTCLLPLAWGDRGRQAAREMAAWIWAHTVCRRIVTAVPEYNRLALQFARAAGMSEYGSNPASFQKHGKLHDQILLGLSRPEEVN